jgi:4-hydroxy-2-oxoheptanedioate aldolase
MLKNAAKTKFENGEPVVNGWLHIPSSVSAEAMAHQGFDTLTIDLQHGPIGYDAALPMLQAISGTGVVPLARAPWNEPGIVMKLLDAGCYGIICPMINTREQCEAFVGACRYPPHGYRSFGPTRVRFYAGADYAEHANEEVLTFAMIETAEALANLDEIMSVPGLDAVYVGPADLSQSLGGAPGADWEEGPVVAALEQVLSAARKHGVIAGLHNTSVAYAKKMLRMGYVFVTVQSDLNFLVSAARETTASFGDGVTEAKASSPY